MSKIKNLQVVEELKAKVSKAKSFVLTDYSGLTHKQLELLHQNLKKVNAEYVVVKNSLLKIATGEILKQVQDDNLKGPTGALLAYEDEMTPLKELYRFIKANSLPKVKFSLLNGIVYDNVETGRIAVLPPKEGLIAQLMFTLNANTQKLAYILTKIKITE